MAASGSFATRTARHTRAIPITELTRSATWSTAASAAAGLRLPGPLPATSRSTNTPLRFHSRTAMPVSWRARRMFACRRRSK